MCDRCNVLLSVQQKYLASFRFLPLLFPCRQVYWTNRGSPKSIAKANMDGSNATQIIVGLTNPFSIVVDSETERIYWADENANVIETSDLEGGDRRILAGFLDNPRPVGLAIYRNLLCIGNWKANSVQSVDKYTGGNLTTLYSTDGRVRQLAITDPSANHFISGINPCEGNGCSHLCVPTGDSYRCLCPENMYLGRNQMSCL